MQSDFNCDTSDEVAQNVRMDHDPLKTKLLTWAVLLSRWVEFAQSSVALPSTGSWGVLRESVADVIMLQALCMALRELGDLPDAERALGLDRAAVLIDKHTRAIQARNWPGGLPDALQELIGDAHETLAQAKKWSSGQVAE